MSLMAPNDRPHDSENFCYRLRGLLPAIHRILAISSAGIAVAAFLCTIAAVLAGVVSRTVFNSPFVWTEELSRTLLVIVVFSGMYWVAQSGRHLAVVLPSSENGSRVVRMTTKWAGTLISMATSGVTGVAAFDYASGLRLRTPSLDIPLRIVFYVVGLGFLGWALHYLMDLLMGSRMPEEKPYLHLSRRGIGEPR